MKTKARCLAQLIIDKEDYSIRATAHAVEQMIKRKIDKFAVSADILALGKERLLEFQKIKDKEIALIDEKRNFAMIVAFRNNTLYVITVIDRCDIFILNGTVVKSMAELTESVNKYEGEKE